MTDRELLELAAKAAGALACWSSTLDEWQKDLTDPYVDGKKWNPLADDGDALRLAVKLRLDLSFGHRYYFDEGPMTFCGTYWNSSESATFNRFVQHGDDPYAATRRAIVRAAAELGKDAK